MPTQHMLLRVEGGYTAGINAGEVWTYGIRLGITYGALSAKGDLPDNLTWFDAAEEATDAGIDYELDWGVQASAGLTFPLMPYLQAVAGALATWHAGPSLISQLAVMRKATLYPIDGPLGRVSEGRKATATWQTPLAGGGGSDVLPLEVATVVSWETLRNGPKGKGRIYLPARVKAAVATDGSITTGQISVIGPGAVELLHDLEYDSGVNPWEVGPIVTGKPYSQYARITGVRLGKVFDAQRRRRNALDEAYTTFDV